MMWEKTRKIEFNHGGMHTDDCQDTTHLCLHAEGPGPILYLQGDFLQRHQDSIVHGHSHLYGADDRTG